MTVHVAESRPHIEKAEMAHSFNHSRYRVRGDQELSLDSISTRCNVEGFSKQDALESLKADREQLAEAQRVLYASSNRALLIVFQAMDAAGKDGTIRHVMSGVNPQGCSVASFKAPTDLEVSHHFLWRPMPFLPAKGYISIFNRSYYEETLVVRVHPQWLKRQNLPEDVLNPKFLTDAGLADGGPPERFWESRFDAIKGLEKQLTDSGTAVLKFYLHVSREEQRERFLERIENPEKHWKFNSGDIAESERWDEYRAAYEQMMVATSTKSAPWYVIPADQKWFMRALVADIITNTIHSMKLEYPVLPPEEREKLNDAAKILRKN